MVALLKQCCCGCTLKTGTIIIAVLSIIGGLYYVATLILAEVLIAKGVPLNSTAEENQLDNDLKAATALIAIGLIIRAIELVTSILLLIAAIQDKCKLMVPWMVVTVVTVILGTIQSIYQGVIAAQNDNTAGAVATFLLLFTIGIPITLYCLYVVYSHYKTLRNGGNSHLTLVTQ